MRLRFCRLVSIVLAVAAGCGEAPVPPAEAPAPAPEGMVWIPGGEFRMGSDAGFPDERPEHPVRVDGFYLDLHEVTNARFAEFVRATGYRTEAEAWGWAAVFDRDAGRFEAVDGAYWRQPEGSGSDLSGREDHPVVHVSHADAEAYARWAGKRLPTEAEWERAARGGAEGRVFAWGDVLRPDGRFMANYWQGSFPSEDTGEDGFRGTAPVGSFPPNDYGVYDLIGNVWEWVADWYDAKAYGASRRENPRGPSAGDARVTRGGSFLCAETGCTRYRVSARYPSDPTGAWNHTGFRCARDARQASSSKRPVTR